MEISIIAHLANASVLSHGSDNGLQLPLIGLVVIASIAISALMVIIIRHYLGK